MIFSIDKFKATYSGAGVSLHLFEQESLIVIPEEESKKGAVNQNKGRETQVPHSSENLRPSMHMSFAGG